MTILVTGARGQVGREVLTELVEAGASVRASSRQPESAGLPGAVEVVRADLAEPDSLPAALDGVRKVFLYAHPDHVAAFVTAAEAAGVEHVVLLSSSSVLMPNAASNTIARRHLAVEEALSASTLDWTFVRPGAFATNTLQWAPAIRATRSLPTAYPTAYTTPIHERDIAAVAVRALLDDAHRGQAYTLSGPESLNQEQQVALIGEAVGAAVRVEVIDRDTQRAEMLKAGTPAPIVDTLLALFESSVDRPGPVADGVAEVLGRPARDYAQWAKDHAEDFR